MRTLLLVVNIVLAFSCRQASATPGRTIPVLPVFKQPYGDGDGSRIVNGQEATPGQFPYQAAVRIDNAAFCGGSLISKNWVLTAGHCVHDFSSWAVTLGAQNIKDNNEAGRVTVESTNAQAHEDYSQSTVANDIGLIQLPTDVAFTDRIISSIKLPPKSFVNNNFVGKSVRVSGWGRVSDTTSGISPTLQFVDLNIISNDECKTYYGPIINQQKYCCSGAESKGTCNGDSGGPLTIGSGNDLTQLAVVSFGSSFGCSAGFPTGFTSTPYFVQWISQKTGISIQDDEDNEY